MVLLAKQNKWKTFFFPLVLETYGKWKYIFTKQSKDVILEELVKQHTEMK